MEHEIQTIRDIYPNLDLLEKIIENERMKLKMKKEEEFVKISKEEYDELIDNARWLNCLNAAGIDNTEAYDQAQDMYEELWGDEE